METTKKRESLEAYLKKRYPVLVYPADDGYVAEIEELPGCMTQGDTVNEVMRRIEDARQGWIEAAYEDGQEIPPPRTEEEHSGKFVVRVPKTLHAQLAEAARRQGVSLNQYVLHLLSGGHARESMRDMVRDILQEEMKPRQVSGLRTSIL